MRFSALARNGYGKRPTVELERASTRWARVPPARYLPTPTAYVSGANGSSAGRELGKGRVIVPRLSRDWPHQFRPALSGHARGINARPGKALVFVTHAFRHFRRTRIFTIGERLQCSRNVFIRAV